MNRLVAISLLTLAFSGGLWTPAIATSRCAEILKTMGRSYVEDAPPLAANMASEGDILGCPADQAAQFALDVTALRDGKKVEAASQLIGTWVSDDVLMIFSGLFIPVYEILEISERKAGGELKIVQKVLRSHDPAQWFASDTNVIPPVEIVAAGRVAIYGEHVAELREPGELEPRLVRYHEFPIEGERNAGLAMKARLMSFSQMRPIEVTTTGDRIVFQIADRMSKGGSRAMTFRKRRSDLPESALSIALIGEISLTKFHCLLEAMDAPTPAFTKALGNHSETEFHSSLREILGMLDERQRILDQMRTEQEESRRSARQNDLKALQTRQQRILETGPIQVLMQEAGSYEPFGCPDYR